MACRFGMGFFQPLRMPPCKPVGALVALAISNLLTVGVKSSDAVGMQINGRGVRVSERAGNVQGRNQHIISGIKSRLLIGDSGNH